MDKTQTPTDIETELKFSGEKEIKTSRHKFGVFKPSLLTIESNKQPQLS